jgi:hypothetical protein
LPGTWSLPPFSLSSSRFSTPIVLSWSISIAHSLFSFERKSLSVPLLILVPSLFRTTS